VSTMAQQGLLPTHTAQRYTIGEEVLYASKSRGKQILCTIESYDEAKGLYRTTDNRKQVPGSSLRAKDEPHAKARKVTVGDTIPAINDAGDSASDGAAPGITDTGAFVSYMTDELAKLTHEGQSASRPPWEMLRDKYAGTLGQLTERFDAIKVICPYSKEAGVNYMGFQSEVPTRSKGTCHVVFFNAFNKSSFPQGLYWPDLSLALQDVLSRGSWTETVQVYPVPGSLIEGAVQPQGAGVMNYGADGPYVCGVNLFVASAIAFAAATAPKGIALPLELMHDLAAIPAAFTKHANAENRCVFALRETAVKSALNRALDPFMLVSAISTIGANTDKNITAACVVEGCPCGL
jgi:hypothetical protein